MNWDDLTNAWRRQPQKTVVDSQYETLKKTFAKKSRHLARRLFWRDVREFLATLLVAYVFCKAAIARGHAGWPLWIAAALALGVGAVFLKERIRAHQKKVGPNASLLDSINSDIGELQHQRQLLLRVRTWYLGPCYLSWLIVMACTRFHGLSGRLQTPAQMIGYFVGSTVLFWLIWKLNKRAVRKKIEPRIADLEKLRHGIISESDQ